MTNEPEKAPRHYWYIIYAFDCGTGSAVYDTGSDWFPIKAAKDAISNDYHEGKNVVILSWKKITKEQLDEYSAD